MFDRESLYVQWGGTLDGGEIWSCGVRMAANIPGILPNEPSDAEVPEWNAGFIWNAVAAFHMNPQSQISSAAKLTFVKTNKIDVNGHYKNQTSNEFVSQPVPGGGGAPKYPHQISLVASLTTGFTRGMAHRGRFYMPSPVSALAADGRITESSSSIAAGAVKTFIEALSDTPGFDAPGSVGVVVMSRKGTGTTRRVTGVEVGRVLDTQRRRRNALIENHSAVAVDA
jgi:hypothetical protein